MKLISMTDFVLEQSELKTKNTELELGLLKSVQLIYNYANYLKQPLTLGMFVPCDEDGNVLEEPNHLDYKSKNSFGELVFNSESNKMKYHANYDTWFEGKEMVIFDEFSFSNNILYNGFQTIKFMNFSNGNVTINLVDYSDEKTPKIQVKTIEDLIPYNLTLINQP